MQKVLVIGGSGFIGSNLIEKLMSMGYYVINYDMKEALPKIANENIQANILEAERLNQAMKGVDIVCHLAAMVGVVNCIQHDADVNRVNVDGVKNVINSCIENQVSNVVFASSSEVYGEGFLEKKLVESAELFPKSVYGKTKLMGEKLFLEFSKKHNAKVSVLRYCNIFGIRQRVEFVIPIFLNQVLKKEPLTICGDGNQVRCYTYVEDAVNGTIAAFTRTKGELYEQFNICSNIPYSVNQVADVVLSLGDGESQKKYVDYEELGRVNKYEIINRIPSNEKAREFLGFKVETSLVDGIQKTYQYYKELMEEDRNE